MKKYKVFWTEVYSFEKEVEATSLEKAMLMVERGDIEYPEPHEGLYIPDSIIIDQDQTRESNVN